MSAVPGETVPLREAAEKALNTPSGMLKVKALDVLRLTAEHARLREGLRQVAEGDYPADAGSPETWAWEVLARPESVEWSRIDDEPTAAEQPLCSCPPGPCLEWAFDAAKCRAAAAHDVPESGGTAAGDEA